MSDAAHVDPALAGGAREDPDSAGAAQGTSGRMPDFFVVGQPKSGTTALYEMLRRHPQIYMPPGKEPWFFAEELRERTPPRPGGIPGSLQEYLRLFEDARAEQRAGEASVMYLWSRTAAGAIAEVQPQARIIAILREPASLLRSLHLQFLESYIEVEADFRKAIALERDRRAGRQVPRHTYWPQALLYSDHVRYVEQLQRYRKRFSPEQMLVLIYDEFRADNEEGVRAVQRFLGVDDTVAIEAVEANPSVQPRSHPLDGILRSVALGGGPASRAVKASIRTVTPRRLRRRLHASRRHVVYRSPAPVDESFALELKRRFKPEVVALSEYLDRDLVGLWGYDRVG